MGVGTLRAVEVIELATPSGIARASVEAVPGAVAAVVLGHGAGGGIRAADLLATVQVATGLPAVTVLVEQPYRVAGRRSPPSARTLDTAWIAIIEALRAGPVGALPVLVGGRSSGARVACRTAGALGADGVLCLAFPLHPPGRAGDPSKSRLAELDAVPVPTLVVQGERDPFGVPSPAPLREVVVVPGDHSLRNAGAVREAVAAWLPVWVAGLRQARVYP